MATFIQENGIREEIGETGRARGARAATGTPFRPYRVALRALGFASFGVVSLTLGLVVLPLQRLAGRWRQRGESAEIRAQRAIHRGMRLWVRFGNLSGFAKVSVHGVDALRSGPVVIVANHPSLIDTPILLSVLPQADLIVNTAWGDNPFLRHCVDGAGYLRAERGAVMVRHAIERLRAGRTLLVYPEGSRTPPEGLRAFERGAAQIALLAGCQIVPVVICADPRALMKGQPFADVPEQCPEWRVEVGPPIHPADYLRRGEGSSAAARRITAALQEYFEKRWERGIR
ncbi:MAG TPA: lysophospholipid acyltransferase family protein [Myxococcota bacterium]|nr:lysophospholipid acyltransferase family protein [Myxococcota bacterium]